MCVFLWGPPATGKTTFLPCSGRLLGLLASRAVCALLIPGESFLDFLHLIRSISDPEHPLTLEELNVVEQVRVKVSLQGLSSASSKHPGRR